jgi:hypothetical protein
MDSISAKCPTCAGAQREPNRPAPQREDHRAARSDEAVRCRTWHSLCGKHEGMEHRPRGDSEEEESQENPLH